MSYARSAADMCRPGHISPEVAAAQMRAFCILSTQAGTTDPRRQDQLRRFQARRADIERFAPTQGAARLAPTLESDDPAVVLRAVGALHRLAEQIEARGVRLARGHGWSWEQIGDALGVSRQSIHAKYGKWER
jgi:hypothetical protein